MGMVKPQPTFRNGVHEWRWKGVSEEVVPTTCNQKLPLKPDSESGPKAVNHLDPSHPSHPSHLGFPILETDDLMELDVPSADSVVGGR